MVTHNINVTHRVKRLSPDLGPRFDAISAGNRVFLSDPIDLIAHPLI